MQSISQSQMCFESLEDRRLYSVSTIPTQTFKLPNGTNFPSNLTMTADGTVWYSTGLNHEIGYIKADGTIGTPIDTSNASSHGMDGLTVGKDGKVWFCEFWDNVIGEVSTSGQVTTYKLPKTYGPRSITLGTDGRLWISTFNNYVGRINSVGHGKASVTWFHHKGEGMRKVVAWNNSIYFQEDDAIGRVSRSGSFNANYKLPHGGSLQDLAVGPDGNLWFTENHKSGSGTNDYIGYVTKAGKVTEYPVADSVGTLSGLARGGNGNLFFRQGDSLEEITTHGTLVASQNLEFIAGGGSIIEGSDGNVWYAEGVLDKIGKTTL